MGEPAQDNQTQDPSKDATQDPEKDKGKTDAPKMVPESDLLAVKSGLEKAVKDAKAASAAEVAQLAARIDAEHQAAIDKQAEIVRLEEQLKESSVDKAKTEELIASVASLTTERDNANKALLEVTKAKLAAQFNVNITTLEDKTQAELNTLETALKLVGAKGKVHNTIDTGPGGVGAGAAPVSVMDICKEEVAEAKASAQPKE